MSQGLFVPPEGTMQFELLEKSCFQRKPFPLALWVGTKERRGDYDYPCDCEFIWPVVRMDYGQGGQIMNDGRPCVCNCMGRIIE